MSWDQDNFVTRRELAGILALGSGILAAATVFATVVGHRRTDSTWPRVRVGSAVSLAAGDSILFRYPTDRDPCILIRTKEGALCAFSQVCTHLSCAVVYRKTDDRLFCPCHQGVFECAARKGGAPPLEGPPTRPLPRITLQVEGDDVFAVGVEV